MTTSLSADFDFVVVGGGFFGCALALYFRSISNSVLLIERGPELMGRASAVNQARIHSGLHYPRSFTTARRSRRNFPLFIESFRECVVDDFEMLYAIARRRSKVSAKRFEAMYRAMGAPIKIARPAHKSLFDQHMIEEVFVCPEYAFDHRKLREHVSQRLNSASVPIRFSTEVERVAGRPDDSIEIMLKDGESLTARTVFNAGYAQINTLLMRSGLEAYPLKHQFTEIALIEPPPDIDGLAVTVMDGPFFSVMPFPAESAYSLTHVQYTPQLSWTDCPDRPSPYELAKSQPHKSRWRHMVKDASRYLPCMEETCWKRSFFDIKTVLLRNEHDDGRPILFHEHTKLPRLFSVLGGKIDNIFDLFDILPRFDPAWAKLSSHLLLDR